MIFFGVVAAVLVGVLGLAALSDRRRRGSVRVDPDNPGLRAGKNLAYDRSPRGPNIGPSPRP